MHTYFKPEETFNIRLKMNTNKSYGDRQIFDYFISGLFVYAEKQAEILFRLIFLREKYCSSGKKQTEKYRL
jgi:hypothetical protein